MDYRHKYDRIGVAWQETFCTVVKGDVLFLKL